MSTKGYCGLYLSDNHFENNIVLKNHHYITFILCICYFLLSCGSDTTEKEITNFARIQCQTIKLKNARFALADSIRILENDTITHKATLQTLKIKADELKSESLVVADSLKQEMDILFKTKLTSEEKKQNFLKAVNGYLEQWSCE